MDPLYTYFSNSRVEVRSAIFVLFQESSFAANAMNKLHVKSVVCASINIRIKRNTNHKKIDQNITLSSPATSVSSKANSTSLSDVVDGDDDEFMFTDSPSLNDTFECAAKIATLAECFNLTRFKDFQRKVIDSTLSGKDSIVVQPTGSGKSLCYQFPPVYQNKKALVGSAQLDKATEDRVFSRDSSEALIFVTPEWNSKPDKRDKVKELASNNMLSLIAIDEAHLYHQWQEFRISYKDLGVLKHEFPSIPILALTATAPSEVMESIKKLVRDPLISKASVNGPNIYLECEELPSGNDLMYFASRVVDKIGNDCTIIYTDFINSVGPIMSELSALDVDSVAYYGEMDVKSRSESYHKWKSGEVNVMVATSAFGMGIDKSDIKHIVRLGVPENVQLGTRFRQGWKRRGECYCNHLLLYL